MGLKSVLIALTKQIKLVRPEALAVYPYSNSLFIDDATKTMIDAGSGGKAYQEVPTDRIGLLLLTHHHFDHTNGWVFFRNAKIMAGQEDATAFHDEKQFRERHGYSRWADLMGGSQVEEWERLWQMPPDVPTQPGFQNIQLDGEFKDGDIFQLGETCVQAIHAPGHSRGHYAFFFPQEKILFSSDLDVSPRGPWYGYGDCNLDDLIDSIHKLMDLEPEILVSSHRRVIDSGIRESFQAYLNIALHREARILEFLQEPHTIDEIAAQNIISEWERKIKTTEFFAKMMIVQHLKRLRNQGKIEATTDKRYVKIAGV